MLQENSRRSKLGGKKWLKETVSTNQLSLIWWDPKSLNAAPTLEEVTIQTCIILFATIVINIFTRAFKKSTKSNRLLIPKIAEKGKISSA